MKNPQQDQSAISFFDRFSGRNIFFETSTRLKSRDSRASRKGKYLKRTRASLQQADPCRYSPRVADGRSSRHGLSLSFAWLSSILRTKLSRCHRPEACVLYLQPKEWFLPPVPDQLVFWETMVYWIFRQDLPFIRIRNMPDETVRRPSSSLRSIWKKILFLKNSIPWANSSHDWSHKHSWLNL